MIFVDKYKLLFISNPKTGTTTVQKQLLELDEGSVLNRLPKSLIEKGLPIKFKEHDTALSVSKGLGDYWFEFSSFVFVRSIHEKAVSAYFFYKNGKPITRHDNKRQLMVRINRLLTQLLPFSIWSLLKPIKTNYEYIIDENGRVLVNHIGKTSHLQEDLELLLKSKNISITYSPSKENISTHKGVDIYFSKALHRKLFTLRYSKEIKLYQSLLKYSISDDLQGRKVDEL